MKNSKHSRNRFRIMALVVMICLSAQGQKKIEITPENFLSTVPMTGTSDFIYYALSEKKRTTISVEGPGVLYVYNRVRLEKDELQSRPYYLKYKLDGELLYSRKIGPQKRSKKIRYKAKIKGAPSKADIEKVTIPPGPHKLHFYKHNTAHKAHVRFFFAASKKRNWQEIQPFTREHSAKLVHHKTQRQKTYYRIGKDRYFDFQSDGSDKLRIYVRADFNYKMHDESVIRLILYKNGRLQKTYKITHKKSNKVAYLNDPKLVPGNLKKIYVDLPDKDIQNYRIALKDESGSAIIRAFLGKPDVNSEEKSL